MEKLIVIRTPEELSELESYLKDKEVIAFDTETTGLDRESQIIGFSIAAEIDCGYYIILSEWDSEQSKLVSTTVRPHASSFLESLKSKQLIMQNATFDCMIVESNFGIQLMPNLIHDTLIGGHLLNENRHNGLKERGVELYGEGAKKEQEEMKTSIIKNGGEVTKLNYELYKADSDLIAKYGAKDAILTLKIFYNDVPQLFEHKLDTFFYEEESMPLLRGPTYELNTTGLRVDPDKLEKLKMTLEAECLDMKAFIYKEISKAIKDKYPGTSKAKTFNIGSTKQLSWLLFENMGNPFNVLTKGGKEVCRFLGMNLPYTLSAKREFIQMVKENQGRVYEDEKFNPKTEKTSRPKKIADPSHYLACGKDTLKKLAPRYKWVEKLLEYNKNMKLLSVYVNGIQAKMKYNIIRPGFLQHGTTSGRYSSRNPNFQNLPRDDKRVKSCIVARPGKMFVGADQSQLEPRIFASFSKDERLLNCFENGDDFYSVIGAETFDKYDCSLKKDEEESFAKLYPELRQISKVFSLAATYGTTAAKMAPAIDKSIDETDEIIDRYFERFPGVRKFMLDSHKLVKKLGYVRNLFGRPRRIPEAVKIEELYGNAPHKRLPYESRNLLNLAVNHRIQSTAASIMNRCAIAFYNNIREEGIQDCHIVLQVHDELVAECLEQDAKKVASILKYTMENTVKLPGVNLIAEPKIANNLADLK